MLTATSNINDKHCDEWLSHAKEQVDSGRASFTIGHVDEEDRFTLVTKLSEKQQGRILIVDATEALEDETFRTQVIAMGLKAYQERQAVKTQVSSLEPTAELCSANFSGHFLTANEEEVPVYCYQFSTDLLDSDTKRVSPDAIAALIETASELGMELTEAQARERILAQKAKK